MIEVIKHIDIVRQSEQENANAQATKNQADIDYIAMMSGIEIPEKDDKNVEV